MQDRTRISGLRAVGTVVASLAVLVGIPVFLVLAVGWPLPRSVPSGDELVRAFQRQGVPVEVVMQILAVVVWIAWSQLVWATVIETIAYARGWSARGGIVPGVHQAARQLVAAFAFLAGTVLSVRPAPAAPATAPAAVAAASPAPVPIAGSSSGPSFAGETVAASPTERMHEVVHGDTFWGLAERYLGSGVRWREIRDHNVGRAVAPGRILGATEDALDVGWRLAIPATEPASVPSTRRPDAGATGTSDAPVTVRSGDNLWRLAERRTSTRLGRPASDSEVRGYWTDVVEANRDRLADPNNPDLIHPGQQMMLPPSAPPPGSGAPLEPDTDEPAGGAPPPSPAEPAPEPPASPNASVPVDTTIQREPRTETSRASPDHAGRDTTGDDEHDEPDADGAVPSLVFGGVTSIVLAVGAVRAISRRRRRRNHLAPARAPVEGGDPDLHRRLVANAHEDRIDVLGRALDDLAARVAAAGYRCRPQVVQHGPDHLDVLLDRPTLPAVEGWQAQANGEVWALDPDAPGLPASDAAQRMAAPLLVTLGQPDDGGQIYVDLEAARLVVFTGDRQVARTVACTMATELAHSPLAANARVIVVGDGLGPARIDHLDRIEAADTWATIGSDLVAWNDQSRDALAANGWPNPFVGRGHDPDHDALIPLVVIATDPPDDVGMLASLTTAQAATAVVVIGEPLPGATIVDCRRDGLSVPQLGLECQPLVLEPDEVDAVADLLDVAEDTGGEEIVFDLDQPPVADGADETCEAHEPYEPYEDPPHEVLVRFLGEIAVEGGRHPLTAKQTALVAYVALHRSVSADRAVDALWLGPSAVSPRKRLANLMTKCRAALGDRHLPVIQDNHYRIGPAVATDVDLFERRVAAAAKMAPPQAAETLRGALDLVRGPLFEYPDPESDSYSWVALGNWISHWELRVTNAARHAAELYLGLGESGEAIEISERTHRVVPTDAGLTETLMRSHAAAGNRHAVHRVFQEHLTALEQLDLDSVAESTAKLYQQLRSD